MESRPGGDSGNRLNVTATSLDGVLNGILITRDSGATLDLVGLASGQEYRLLILTSDNHASNINPGLELFQIAVALRA